MPLNLDLKFKNFLRGATTPVRALQTIFHHPRLIFISIFPMMVTAVAIALSIYAILTGAWSFGTAWFQSFTGQYTGLATGVFAFIVGSFTFYLLFHSIGILLSLLSSPFNDWLAEETERACGKERVTLSFRILFLVFLSDIRKSVLTLTASLGFWLLAFVPVLGLIAPLGFTLITTLTFISYPQSRRHLGIFECLLWIKSNIFLSLGFGLTTTLLFGIPVINVFALPLAVVGGTLLFLENEAVGKNN